MNELLFPVAGGLIGYALCEIWRRHIWRVRAAWPTRCAKCGKWQPHYKTMRVLRTTNDWVNLCGPCFKAEYHPWTP